MAIHRSRKSKENPHYGFLVSWQPKSQSQARVKGESDSGEYVKSAMFRHGKKAVSSAQAELASSSKKTIIRSLIQVSFILILELVVYLAWRKLVLS
jgi:hypothetical protein